MSPVRLDHNGTTLGHGVRRVPHKVEQGHLELPGVELDHLRLRGELERQAYPVTGHLLEDVVEVGDELVQIDRSVVVELPTGE